MARMIWMNSVRIDSVNAEVFKHTIVGIMPWRTPPAMLKKSPAVNRSQMRPGLMSHSARQDSNIPSQMIMNSILRPSADFLL